MKRNRDKNEDSEDKFIDFEKFEVGNLWRAYEKSIEIGSVNPSFANIKIPTLILFYELVNCDEMKSNSNISTLKTTTTTTTETTTNKDELSGCRNAQILDNLCELIDKSDESASTATSLDRVLNTVTKQIIKNGISVFFPSENECREYFFDMIAKNSRDNEETAENKKQATAPKSSKFNYETSLSKSSGKLLFEAFCNLFCSNRSNMIQHLVGAGRSVFEAKDSHKSVLELIEKIIELSFKLNEQVVQVETTGEVANKLIVSLVDLLNSIQSNLFFKAKECLSTSRRHYLDETSREYENNLNGFLEAYVRLLIAKSRLLLMSTNNAKEKNTILHLKCFFNKLLYNLVLWLSEIFGMLKLTLATKFVQMLIELHELVKSLDTHFQENKVIYYGPILILVLINILFFSTKLFLILVIFLFLLLLAI